MNTRLTSASDDEHADMDTTPWDKNDLPVHSVPLNRLKLPSRSKMQTHLVYAAAIRGMPDKRSQAMESFVQEVQARMNELASEYKTTDTSQVMTRPFTRAEEETYNQRVADDMVRDTDNAACGTDNEDARATPRARLARSVRQLRRPRLRSVRQTTSSSSRSQLARAGRTTRGWAELRAGPAQRAPASPAACTNSGPTKSSSRESPRRVCGTDNEDTQDSTEPVAGACRGRGLANLRPPRR